MEELSKNISEILYDQKYDLPKMSLTQVFYKTLNERGLSEALTEFKRLKDNKNDYYVKESDLNGLGYSLLAENKFEEAIEVFKLNVEVFPSSSNVYDSLGEAYLKNGNTELAVLNYKKSVELNQKNESGKKILDELQNR